MIKLIRYIPGKIKTRPRIQKHFPESKNTSRNPKHVPEFKNTFQNPDSGMCLDSGKCFVLMSHRSFKLVAGRVSSSTILVNSH